MIKYTLICGQSVWPHTVAAFLFFTPTKNQHLSISSHLAEKGKGIPWSLVMHAVHGHVEMGAVIIGGIRARNDLSRSNHNHGEGQRRPLVALSHLRHLLRHYTRWELSRCEIWTQMQRE